MAKKDRTYKLNHILRALLQKPFEWFFRFTHDNYTLDEPTLVVCNHVTNFDVILASLCCPGYHMHFVASEHMFRKGILSAFLRYVFDPISRRKGVSGADTAMACLRKLKAGKSVFIFAEGETSWDGRTQDIFPGIGRMARISGARLITYRLEGGYLTAPRWGKGIRRGRMQGRIMGTYTPEQLKTMKPEEIDDLIRRDIYEDAWQRQEKESVIFKGNRRAEKMEAVLFICPRCGEYSTLKSHKNTLSCTCGLQAEVTYHGTFADERPFKNLAQWDAWQRQKFVRQLSLGNIPVLSEENMTLYALHQDDHGQDQLCTGTLRLEQGALHIGSETFPLTSISGMGLVMGNGLVFHADGRYLELRAKEKLCLRKYYLAWQHAVSQEPIVSLTHSEKE